MIYFILIFTLIFCVFIEIYIGGISIRRNSENINTFHFSSLLSYLIHPLHNSFLWHPDIIIANYPFMIGMACLINLIFTT
jgi:hypothetical protein